MNIPLISNLVGMVSGAFTEWMTLRRIKAEGRINLERARQDAELKRATAVEDYDTLAVQGMQYSWKDEFLVLVFTFILVANFLPGVQNYVIIGWGYLEKAPDWFTYSYMGMVAASFGSRWIMQNRFLKGPSPHSGSYVKTFAKASNNEENFKGDD